jgi:hypothetical protein
MVLSVSIILVNKYVVAASGFSFPMTLAAWHMALGTATARCAVWALGMPDTIREHASPALYSQLASIGVLFAGVLVTSNASLMLLSVPAVQMLKVRLLIDVCVCSMVSNTGAEQHTVVAPCNLPRACPTHAGGNPGSHVRHGHRDGP